MSDASICPACVALPEATRRKAVAADHVVQHFSLPGIHCAACIATVERGLAAEPGVMDVRVNLSAKRVAVTTQPSLPPEALMDALARLGFTALPLEASLLAGQSDRVGRALLTRIAVSGFAMMNVMLLSVAVWSGAAGATLHLFHLISASIAVPAVLYAAQPFFSNAWQALRAARLNMDVPISLAIVLACGMSTFETLVGGEEAYFDAALSLTFFLLVGRYLDHRSRAAARSAASELAAMETPRVQRIDAERTTTINLSDLAIGDVIRVLPGGRIPVDGVIISGEGLIDRSMLTGESLPVEAGIGQGVTAGEVTLTAPLDVRVTTVGDDTTLRRMARMIEAAETSRNGYTAIADRAARIYAPAVHLLALVAFTGWWVGSGDVRLALNIAIATLIITCPCALGLAVPAVSTAAAGRMFRTGLLVKDATALERLSEVDTVVLDKTGTLTEPGSGAADLSALTAEERRVAYGLATQSLHPISGLLCRTLEAAGCKPATVTDLKEVPGRGISGTWGGQAVLLGNRLHMDGIPGTALQIGSEAIRSIPVRAPLRSGAEALVAAWKDQGLALHLVSGDDEAPTAQLAHELGIDHWAARTTPEGKVRYLQDLAHSGAKVLMVGDGLNDTAALAEAHASISPASAADAARTASDFVLLNPDFAALRPAPGLARLAMRRIFQNFGIAATYNAIAIPLAVSGLATPLMAAIAMSTSSVLVVLNALRLGGAR